MNEENEILEVYNSAAPEMQNIIFALLACATEFGDEFYRDMNIYYERKDRDGMIDAIRRWDARRAVKA